MQARDFLEFAKTLDVADEAARRSAVSRAYYALYHAAGDVRDVAPDHGRRDHSYGSHHELVRFFAAFPVAPDDRRTGLRLRSLGITLGSAKALRQVADYHFDQGVDSRQAASIVTQCESAIGKADALIALFSRDESA